MPSEVMLSYREPYRYEQLLGFLEFRAIEGVESVCDGAYRRIVRPRTPEGEAGWINVCSVPEESALRLTVSGSLGGELDSIEAHTRLLFDTDCDPHAVQKQLADFHERTEHAFAAPGVRVPCSFDGFEMATRAVVGQQITVRAANTLAGRIAAAFGTPLGEAGIETPFPELTTVFPAPDAFLAPDAVERLGQLGVIRQRAQAICTIAALVAEGSLTLAPGANVNATEKALLAIPGIGPWTAQYILMRALAYPDALPATDYGVKHAFPGLTPRRIEKASAAWQPMRSYAVMSIWQAPKEAWSKVETPAKGEEAKKERP